MKVSDVMQRSIISVSEDTSIAEVGRLIFNIGVAGIPVVKGRKLVGIVTEQDILSRMYPTMQEVVEDYTHSRDFEQMEKNLTSLLYSPVKKIMVKTVTSIGSDTPIMHAQSIMLINKFSRLPVVDKENNLIGIISQGDIFRQLIRNEVPRLEKERYADFIATHYDLMVNWEKRFKYELPALFYLFKQEKVEKVLDLGAWTGEYTIALAKEGMKYVLGADHNTIMYKISEAKKEKLAPNIRKNIDFLLTDYKNLSKEIKQKFDSIVLMGNALPYIPLPLDHLFKQASSLLREKNGVLIIQTLNFEKILKQKNRLLSFIMQKSKRNEEKEHLFVEFFDKKEKDQLLHHVIVFDSDGKNWIFKGITTVPIFAPTKNELEKALVKSGFKEISFSGNNGEYQGDYGRLSFEEKFEPLKSDWLNVVAIR